MSMLMRILPLLALVAGLSACGQDRTPQDQEPFIDRMIWSLTDGDLTVRRCAARALGRLGPCASKAVPALGCALYDNDETVREAVQLALLRIQCDACVGGAGR